MALVPVTRPLVSFTLTLSTRDLDVPDVQALIEALVSQAASKVFNCKLVLDRRNGLVATVTYGGSQAVDSSTTVPQSGPSVAVVEPVAVEDPASVDTASVANASVPAARGPGSQGPATTGFFGAQGPASPAGFPGTQGTSTPSGFFGAQGPATPAGFPGTQGPATPTGFAGPHGSGDADALMAQLVSALRQPQAYSVSAQRSSGAFDSIFNTLPTPVGRGQGRRGRPRRSLSTSGQNSTRRGPVAASSPDDEETCAICHEEDPNKNLQCGHWFHKRCLRDVGNKTVCPNCLSPLPEPF